MTTDWKAFEKAYEEADRFVGTYDRTGKTFRDFWDEFNVKFPDIWKAGEAAGAPEWVAGALEALAINSEGFEPSSAGVGLDDLILPHGAREGLFDEDLAAALNTIGLLPEFWSEDFEAQVMSQYDRLTHYHLAQSKRIHEAIRLHIASLRQSAAPPR